MFLQSLYNTLVDLASGTSAKKKDLEKTTELSYVCVYLDTQNRELAVPLKEYFNGKHIKFLSEKINRTNRFMVYDIPVYDNLYDAQMFLGRHGRGGPDSRYILVIDCVRDTALELIKENDENFHKKIKHAINWQSLVKEHGKYIKNLPDQSTFSQVKVYDNPNIKICYPPSILTSSEQIKPQNSCTIL